MSLCLTIKVDCEEINLFFPITIRLKSQPRPLSLFNLIWFCKHFLVILIRSEKACHILMIWRNSLVFSRHFQFAYLYELFCSNNLSLFICCYSQAIWAKSIFYLQTLWKQHDNKSAHFQQHRYYKKSSARVCFFFVLLDFFGVKKRKLFCIRLVNRTFFFFSSFFIWHTRYPNKKMSST